MKITALDRKMSKIENDLLYMTCPEILAYIKAIANGATQTSYGITFYYKGYEIWAGNFDEDGRSENTNIRKVNIKK